MRALELGYRRAMDIDALRRELADLDTAALCDAERSIRVMDAGIRPVRAGLVLVGIARTVRADGDFLTVLAALREAAAGEVLVVDAQGGRRAVAGELFSTEAHRKGLAGIVIDGACRDIRQIRELPMPVYARSSHPLAGTSRELQATQVPVSCGGVTVSPGDVVFGDDDGIVVVSPADLSRLLPRAREIRRAEQEAVRRMGAGESLFDRLNFEEHAAAIREGRESRLKLG
jgi:4-hydroxy-4-methyl-2-oxoglutarate aldolase